MPTSKQRLLADVARFARSRKGKLSLCAFSRATRISREKVLKAFPDGFHSLLIAARLAHRTAHRRWIPSDELLADYHRLHQHFGRRPTWSQVQKHGRFSIVPYFRRFGRTEATLAAYEKWKAQSSPAPRPDTTAARIAAAAPSSPRPAADHLDFPHGTPLSFRGLLHAPVCESGVIHLFGVLHAELGYSIISIKSTYPDCLALRPSPTDPDRWEPTRIEFEFKASNFQRHGHDEGLCDLIVCWENDWPDSPIKVLDLKTELRRVQALKARA